MKIVIITPIDTSGPIGVPVVKSMLSRSATIDPIADDSVPSGFARVIVDNATDDEAALIALDPRFSDFQGPIPRAEILSQYESRQQAAATARTQAAILHLATAQTPDAIASRVVFRRLFTMLNDVREHLGLPRILESELVTQLIADAQNGQGAPISLT